MSDIKTGDYVRGKGTSIVHRVRKIVGRNVWIVKPEYFHAVEIPWDKQSLCLIDEIEHDPMMQPVAEANAEEESEEIKEDSQTQDGESRAKEAFHIVQMTYTAPDGVPGTDKDPHNPLARALNRLFEEGQPFERFSVCHFYPSPLGDDMKWFGTFVFSAGGRLIYFPGLAERKRGTVVT